MKTLVSTFFLFLFVAGIGVSQNIITCPADVEVKHKDLDPNLNYGDPTVLIPQPYSLTVSTEEVVFNCSGSHFKTIEKTWALFYSGNTETCSQVVFVLRNEFSDFSVPADTTLASGDPYNIDPAITGYYGPANNNEGTIATTYSDTVILNGPNGTKVLRTWVMINWCDASTIEHNQVISIGAIIGNSLTVNNPKGKPIGGYTFELLDSEGNSLGNPNCGGNIVEQINCIFSNNPNIMSIELKMSKEGSVLNGVSTLDIVLTQRHILGITPFEDPYQSIAADVNASNTVSAFDLIIMKRVILGINTEFPDSPSWKFFNDSPNGDLVFTNDELPLGQLDIIAVKIGDVNCTSQ